MYGKSWNILKYPAKFRFIRVASIVKVKFKNFSTPKQRNKSIEIVGRSRTFVYRIRRVAKIWPFFFRKIEKEHGNLERRRSVKIPKTKNYFR